MTKHILTRLVLALTIPPAIVAFMLGFLVGWVAGG